MLTQVGWEGKERWGKKEEIGSNSPQTLGEFCEAWIRMTIGLTAIFGC